MTTSENGNLAPCARCGSATTARHTGADGTVYCDDIMELRSGCTASPAWAPASKPVATSGGTVHLLANGCPKCGGQQFKARRSGARRAMIGTSFLTLGVLGAPALAAGKNKVECVLCGTQYDRKI